jgi:lysozyme family protein
MTVDELIDDILRREGGFVDHPHDRGGPTKFGITLTTLAAWRRRPVTVEDVRDLAPDEARGIYRSEYVEKPGFDRISDPRLRALVVDCGVNHGQVRATRWLQRAAGVVADGKLGSVTLGAVNTGDALRLFLRVIAQRIRFYGEIVRNDPTQATFIAGWNARAAEFLERY